LQAGEGPLAGLQGTPITGYEIHMGRTQPTNPAAPRLCRIGRPGDWHPDGVLGAGGRIWGTYLHGIFDNDTLRHAWLSSLGWRQQGHLFDRQQAYNRLAEHVRAHLDMEALRAIIWG
jgi:adenosylcobyric acid synthase